MWNQEQYLGVVASSEQPNENLVHGTCDDETILVQNERECGLAIPFTIPIVEDSFNSGRERCIVGNGAEISWLLIQV